MTETTGTYTRQQIADAYGIHPRTLNRKLKRQGIALNTGALTPADILKIEAILGELPRAYFDPPKR